MSSFSHNAIKYEIASPCDQSWEQMSGDDKCRHCDLCDKKVFNLSSMSDSEVSSLIEGPSDVCVRLFKREDGKVLKEDCPIGLAAVKKHLSQKQFLAAGLCLVTLLFSSFSMARERGKIMGKMVAVQTVQEETESKSLETVEPESDWDYEKKQKIVEDKPDIMLMGAIAPAPKE